MKNLPDDPINAYIRQRIRAIRMEKRLSVREAAYRSEIPESSYSCIEQGYYRITLQNLCKILPALRVGIEAVWPPEAHVSSPTQDLSSSESTNPNYFRFREIFTLTKARQAALMVVQNGAMDFLYWINVDQPERRHLKDSIARGISNGWKICRKNSRGMEVYLCLKEPSLEEHLLRLMAIYMDLWLATFLTELKIAETSG